MEERTDEWDESHDLRALASGRTVPRRLISVSARLLTTQYHLWSRDLKDPEQPLIEYGFRLSADPAGIDGRACRYDAVDGLATILLEQTIVHGRPDGNAVAIDRRTLGLATAWIHAWAPVARIERGAPRDAGKLVPGLISWIGGYEQWIFDSWGEGRRSAWVETQGLGGELPGLWWKLAAQWRVALGTGVLTRPGFPKQ